MKSNVFRFLIFFILFAGLISPLRSETLHMKNGDTRYGRIVSQTRTMIRIVTPDGDTEEIQKKDIRRIQYTTSEQEKKFFEEKKRKEEEERRKKKEEEERRLEEERKKEDEARLKKEEEERRIREEKEKLEEAREQEQERVEDQREAREDALAETMQEMWLETRHSLTTAIYSGKFDTRPYLMDYFDQLSLVRQLFDGGFGKALMADQMEAKGRGISVDYVYHRFFSHVSIFNMESDGVGVFAFGGSDQFDDTTGSLTGKRGMISLTRLALESHREQRGHVGWYFFSSPSLDIGLFGGISKSKTDATQKGIEVESDEDLSGVTQSAELNLLINNHFTTSSDGLYPGIAINYRMPWNISVHVSFAQWTEEGNSDHKWDTYSVGLFNSTNGFRIQRFNGETVTAHSRGEFRLEYEIIPQTSIFLKYSAAKADMKFNSFGSFFSDMNPQDNPVNMYLMIDSALKNLIDTSSETKGFQLGATWKLNFGDEWHGGDLLGEGGDD